MMRLLRMTICCLFGLLLSTTAMAESATVTRAARLTLNPYTDAQVIATLQGGAAVEILERRGGWYRVKTVDGRNEGWLRMASVHLGEQSAAESETSFWGSLFAWTGRSQSRTTVATTGVRGLSEEEINAAAPDAAAVKRLDLFAASDKDARQFAAGIELQDRKVNELPKDAKESKK